MPNQRGCAACALEGSIRHAPLMVGWGVARLKPEGCRPASSQSRAPAPPVRRRRPSSKGRGLCTSSRARDSHTHSRQSRAPAPPVRRRRPPSKREGTTLEPEGKRQSHTLPRPDVRYRRRRSCDRGLARPRSWVHRSRPLIVGLECPLVRCCRLRCRSCHCGCCRILRALLSRCVRSAGRRSGGMNR